jgi:virginiamycin B lyase
MEPIWGPGMGHRVLRGGATRVVIAMIAVVIAVAAAAARASAAPLTEFPLPAGTTATTLIDGTDGALWFGETTSTNKPEIGRITTAGVITQITSGFLPGAVVHAVAAGAGGTIWFADDGTTKAIGKVTAAGQVTEIPAGTPGSGLNAGAVPYDMVTAPDGTVWFEDSGLPGVGAISPSGQITEYKDMTGMPLGPRDLTVDAAGNAWYTRQGGMGIGEVNLGAAAGTPVTVFPTLVPMANGITAGDDGNLWYTGNGYSVIGRITHAGVDTEFGPLDGLQMGATPDAITAGPDGNVWFDDQDAPNFKVGKITPAGQITEYPLSDNPWDLTVGIDGNLWVLQGHTTNGIDRVTPAGKVDLFTAGLLPTVDIYDGTNLVSGPDGNLWFIDIGTPNAIVRADVQLPPAVTTGAAANVTASSAQLEGTANARGAASTITVQYGTTPALGSSGAAGSEPAGDTTGAVAGTVTGLPAATVIYYRLVASNAYGTVFGNTLSFTTAAGPPPVVVPTTRTLHATIGNQRITITVPATTSCLAPGTRLSLNIGSATIVGSKAAKLSFKRAVVFIDRGVKRTRTKVVTVRHHKHRKRLVVHVPNATARRLPATLSLSLQGRRSGTHALRITLTYTRTRHVKHRIVRTTVTKTIKATFAIC